MKPFNTPKRLLLPTLLAAGLVTATAAHAGKDNYNHKYDRYQQNGYTVDSAPVTQVDPIYETVRIETPRRECRTEAVERQIDRPRHRKHHRHHVKGGRSITPEIIGAVIGAGLGHQFGRGRGKDIGTVAGAVLGASVGHDIKRHNRRHRRHHDQARGEHYDSNRTYVEHVEVCEDVLNFHEEKRVVGYRVQYRYNGQQFWTETSHDPGERIEVRVSVTPVSS